MADQELGTWSGAGKDVVPEGPLRVEVGKGRLLLDFAAGRLAKLRLRVLVGELGLREEYGPPLEAEGTEKGRDPALP